MRPSLTALLALIAVPVLANPIASTLIRRQEEQELNNEEAICGNVKNPKTWYHYGMDQYVMNEAIQLDDITYVKKMEDYMPKLAAESWSCEWKDDTCEQSPLNNHCLDNPKAAYSLLAVTNMVAYLRSLSDLFSSVAQELEAAYPKFTVTFNPKEISTKAGTTPFGGMGTSLFFIGAVAAFAPGVNIIAAAGTVGTALNRLSTVTYAAGALAGTLNMGSGGDDSIEVQFLNAANLQDFLARMIRTVSSGFEKYISHILVDKPLSSIDAGLNHKTRYEDEPSELPQLLKDGTFAGPLPGPSESMRQNLTAAMAAPGINAMWARAGVVVAKVNKTVLPIDPCFGDNLFPAQWKVCDGDGNMFILQGALDGEDKTNPSSYNTPGVSELSRWNLTVYDVITSAYKNQNDHGSKGPKPEDFLNQLLKDSPTNLARENYLFFSMPVCDFAKNPNTETIRKSVSDICGKFEEKNAMCWFYVHLNSLCPCQYFNGQPWPFNPTIFRQMVGKCPRLSSLPPGKEE
jgi:hypothetical protein